MSLSNDGAEAHLYLKNPWENNSNQVWLSSTLSIFRNIDKFNFPSKLNTDKQKTIINLASTPLLNYQKLSNPSLIHAEEMDPLDKEYLTEHFLSSEGFYQAHAGEAFVIDRTGKFLATINIHDHLRLTIMDSTGEIENRWNELVELETTLGESLKYSFSQRFGFLTSDPTTCGTGIEITVYLQLPALIHSEVIDDTLSRLVDENVTISGLHGSPTEVIGDILMIKNNYTLGTTDEKTLTTIENVTTKLVVKENSQRAKLKSSDDSEIKDRVSRAFGILMHSYQIDAVEALNALSLIKLGVDLNWITGTSIEELNMLFFNCRRAHLIYQFEKNITQEELLHKRAEYIHNFLKSIELTI
ncbi:MAG: protein arginine kinase [Chlamydiota bacterium]